LIVYSEIEAKLGQKIEKKKNQGDSMVAQILIGKLESCTRCLFQAATLRGNQGQEQKKEKHTRVKSPSRKRWENGQTNLL